MKTIIQQRIADAINMPLPELIKRDCQVPAIPNKTFAIIGMRRSGKTYYLYQTMQAYLDRGIHRERLLYINFEDERLLDMTINDMHWIVDEYFAIFPENRGTQTFFFFDEIQRIDQWEIFIRRLMDTENIQIYVSGSSAKMLSAEIASSMRGRSVERVIYPYSFREFLRCHDIPRPESIQLVDKGMRSFYENYSLKYLTTGGFPEVQFLPDYERQLLLQQYANTVTFRDIVDRYNVQNLNVLKKLIHFLIVNAGGYFSVNKFYHLLKSNGIKVSKNTLHEYLEYIQGSYLLKMITIHSQSDKKRMVNPMKPYIIDTGLAASFSSSQTLNYGHHLENCIFVELCRRNARISYLKTSSGYEIDFIADYPDGARDIIQVSADISSPSTREREIRALYEVNTQMSHGNLILINLSEENNLIKNDVTIHIMPAWKWLLL
ncbi:MAG: ATP-binding protein [Candidatus Magnetomorum sp.]|nr:ATP-binding protein [Candidatus Magnetomorum sp.]